MAEKRRATGPRSSETLPCSADRALRPPAAAGRAPMTETDDFRGRLPDVRDGLTRLERVILWQLALAQAECPGHGVSTALLYGRVVEHVDVSSEELQRALTRLVGCAAGPAAAPRRRGRRR